MVGIQKLEGMVAGWLKPVPHLPHGAQKWIATNVWWIVLVGVIVSAIGLLIGLTGLLAALALVGSATTYYGTVVTNSYYGGGWILNAVITLIFTVGIVALLSSAIAPLKANKKKGWTILFLVLLLDAVYVVVNSILSLSIVGFIFGIIFGAIGLAVATYLLFEIRSHFVAVKSAPAKK